MIRHATTVGRQATWHVIVLMILFVTCAMFPGMWLDSVQKPMFLEIAVVVVAEEEVVVELVVVVVVVTEM